MACFTPQARCSHPFDSLAARPLSPLFRARRETTTWLDSKKRGRRRRPSKGVYAACNKHLREGGGSLAINIGGLRLKMRGLGNHAWSRRVQQRSRFASNRTLPSPATSAVSDYPRLLPQDLRPPPPAATTLSTSCHPRVAALGTPGPECHRGAVPQASMQAGCDRPLPPSTSLRLPAFAGSLPPRLPPPILRYPLWRRVLLGGWAAAYCFYLGRRRQPGGFA